MTKSFRRVVTVLAFAFLIYSSPVFAQPTVVTNAEVVKMVEGRVPPPIIVATIERSLEPSFNLGPDELIELKKRGVPDAVLEAMLKKTMAAPVAPTTSTPATISGKSTGEWGSRERGVYLELPMVSGKELVRLTEAKVTGMKVGGGFGSVLTYGAKKMTAKYRIRDGAAEKRGPVGGSTFYIAKLDPRDLILLRVSKKGKEREFESGKVGGFSGGVEAVKGDLEFISEEVAPGIYRVVFARPLEPGEYGFGVVNMGSVNPLYDFGIDPPATSSVSR